MPRVLPPTRRDSGNPQHTVDRLSVSPVPKAAPSERGSWRVLGASYEFHLTVLPCLGGHWLSLCLSQADHGKQRLLIRWLLHGFLKTWCFVVEHWKGHEDGDCQPLGMISLDQLDYLSDLYFSNISLRCKKGLQGCLYFFLSV